MRFLLFLLFALGITLSSNAQVIYKNTELGFGVGGSNYYGDINQTQHFNYARYSGSFFGKYNFNPYISLKAMASYGKIGGSDKFNTTKFEKSRNLSFENDIVEIAAASEFNFLYYEPGSFEHRFTPYIVLGLGAFYHDPYAYINNSKKYLRPLGTEGQNIPTYANRKYNKINPTLLTGLGFKFWMKGPFTLGFEAGYRFTNTDYLDDVSTTYVGIENFPAEDPTNPFPNYARNLQDRSPELSIPSIGIANKQRGINSTKDQYLFAQLTFSFRMADYACPDQ